MQILYMLEKIRMPALDELMLAVTRLGEAENNAADVAQNTHNGGIHDFPIDEPAEHLVHKGHFLQHQLRPPGLQGAAQNQHALPFEFLSAGQQVHRDNQPNQKILQKQKNPPNTHAHTAFFPQTKEIDINSLFPTSFQTIQILKIKE